MLYLEFNFFQTANNSDSIPSVWVLSWFTDPDVFHFAGIFLYLVPFIHEFKVLGIVFAFSDDVSHRNNIVNIFNLFSIVFF